MIALDAIFRDMRETGFFKGFFRKTIVRTFGFLQANHIRLQLLHQLKYQRLAQPH